MQTTISTNRGYINIYSFRKGDRLLDAESKTPNYNNYLIFISLNKKRFSFEIWLKINQTIKNDNDNVSIFTSFLSNIINNNLDYPNIYEKTINVLGVNLKTLLSELNYKYFNKSTYLQIIFNFLLK